MGRRGPPPKPAALKRRQGTWRKDRAAPRALELPPGVPKCPRHLPREARAIWLELVAAEQWRVVLTTVDGAALELLVRHLALERRYARAAQRRPMISTPYGPRPHPAAAEARREATIVRGLLNDFGLSPAARTRISKPAPGRDAPADGTPLVGPGLQVLDGGKTDG